MTKSDIEGYDYHHVRPTSRNGDTRPSNCILIPRKERHAPYHRHFMNLCPDEAALLLFFCWETINPYLFPDRYPRNNTERYQRSWTTLFGADATKEDAIRVLGNEFARTADRAVHMQHAKQVMACARHYELSNRNLASGQLFVCGNDRLSLPYRQLYGTLYVHEAIILTFLCWNTFCPILEAALPPSIDSRGRRRPPRVSFSKRLGAWNDLFEELDRAQVVERIARDFAPEALHRGEVSSVTRAIKLCRELERLSCI